ncbi:hypothetical protein Bca101_076622 [Brassica carinata]
MSLNGSCAAATEDESRERATELRNTEEKRDEGERERHFRIGRVGVLSSGDGGADSESGTLGTGHSEGFRFALLTRYVASDLATDVVVNVVDVKFYLHKFPLLSKSARLQKLIAATVDEQSDAAEINIPDIPGGPPAFEMCAKFCYGMTVTLSAYNVVAARCAAEYLEMYESTESGNLVYKIEFFLSSSVLRSWKDSITVLQTTRTLHPWSEDVKKIDERCLESIASKAAAEPARVDWSYTYNRRKVSNDNGVARDWWVEDLAELSIDLYKRVVSTIRRKGGVSPEVIGEALEVYAAKRIQIDDDDDVDEQRCLLETLVSLLPSEKQSVSCGFLIKLLKSSVSLEDVRRKLSRRIGEKLEEASVDDLLIRASSEGCQTVYNIDIVETLIDEFITQTKKRDELVCSDMSVSDSSKSIVAKLMDGYLAEISRIEPNFSTSKFIAIAEKVSCFPRSSHDGVYRAIDMFLKETTRDKTSSSEKTKAKGAVMSRIFSKLWAGKDRDGGGDVSSSDTSESPGSATTTVDDKSTPSTRRRRSSS